MESTGLIEVHRVKPGDHIYIRGKRRLVQRVSGHSDVVFFYLGGLPEPIKRQSHQKVRKG